MKKTSNKNISAILDEEYSLEHLIYMIENITESNIPSNILQEIKLIYIESEFNTLEHVLFQIEVKYAQYIYDNIDVSFSTEPARKKKISISPDILNDIIKVNQKEIKDMDLSIFCNEVDEMLNYSESTLFTMLDMAYIYVKKSNKQIKQFLKEKQNIKEDQIIEFDEFNEPIFNSSRKISEHPIFNIKDIYEGKISYLEQILATGLKNRVLSYYDFLNTSYFSSNICKIDMFPIPSNIDSNSFFEIVSIVNQKHKNNFYIAEFIQFSVQEYIYDNYYFKKVNNNEKNETVLYNDEFSRLIDFQSFTKNLLNINSSYLKYSFIDIVACKINPSNIFMLPKEKISEIFSELSYTDFLDEFYTTCSQHFPVSRKTIFNNICNQIFNHFDINSVNDKFISLLSKNQTLSLKFSLQIDENHDIFKPSNQEKLLKLAHSTTSVLENAPLSFWKKLLISPEFSSVYKSGIFIHAPKKTELYTDEIFISYLNYNNSDYKYLTLNHDTAVKLLVKFYNHKDILADLKNNDDEYHKYGNKTHNKYQLSYEKDFFIALLKHIDPSKLYEEVIISNTPGYLFEIITSEFNTYGKYYNFDKKIKNEITEENYTKEIIHFLSKLDEKTLFKISEHSSFSLPEGVFLSAISLKPDSKLQKFLTQYIQIMLKDVIQNNDTMSDEKIYDFCSSTNTIHTFFIHNKEVFSKIPFQYFEEALISIDKILYRIQNSEHCSKFDYLIRNFNNKSLFSDAPEVLNFCDLIDVVSSKISKKEMLKDLDNNETTIVKASKARFKKF